MTPPEPLHVLHVSYDMRIGGTEQVIRNLIEASDHSRVRSSIFCIEEPLGPWGHQLSRSGTAIHSIQRRDGFDWRVVKKLRRVIKQAQVDVVHCHQYTPWVYGALAAVGLKVRVIFTEHGRFHPDSSSPKRRYINPLLARITDHITAISKATKQALVDYEYLPKDRIDVVYNGIKGLETDPAAALKLRSELGIPSAAAVLGTVARFDAIKNHPMMLRAFSSLLDDHPDSWLVIVGDGEERAATESLIDELQLNRRVILPGYQSDPSAWLNLIDIYLLSSFSEGTSMTLLEAMSLGKPCVVTNVGGNPEIVENAGTGYVTATDDYLAFKKAIEALLKASATEADTYRARALERFHTHFTAKAMARSYEALYQQGIDA
jgi:glycosyltransferase involved in cell wall biosynthesis